MDNCYIVGNIQVSSNHNVENPKLGDEGFVNPFAINDDLVKNSFASKHDDDLFAKYMLGNMTIL